MLYSQILGTICSVSSGLPVRLLSTTVFILAHFDTSIWEFILYRQLFKPYSRHAVATCWLLWRSRLTSRSDWTRRAHGSHWWCNCIWADLDARPVFHKRAAARRRRSASTIYPAKKRSQPAETKSLGFCKWGSWIIIPCRFFLLFSPVLAQNRLMQFMAVAKIILKTAFVTFEIFLFSCKSNVCVSNLQWRHQSAIQEFYNDKDRREFISAGAAAGYESVLQNQASFSWLKFAESCRCYPCCYLRYIPVIALI